MKAILKMIFIVALGASIGCVSAQTATSKDVQRVTKEELKSMLDNPEVIILDVRLEQQWKASGEVIRGAVHENVNEVNSWARDYSKDKTLILY